MTITAALLYAKPNHLAYLITSTAGAGESVYIESDGGPTPDLTTDTVAGPLKQIANATTGYGKIPSTGLTTQAQAQALLLSANAASLVGPAVPTALCHLQPRTGGGWQFVVDAVRGPSDSNAPGIQVRAPGAAGTAILIVEIPGAIGA